MPFDVDAHYFTLLEEPARHGVLRTICCFDLLANSADRKGGHCLAGDDGRVWAVDNGLTFHEETKLRTVIWDFAGEPIDRTWWPAPTAWPEEPAAGARRPARRRRVRALVDRARRVAAKACFPVDHTGRRYPWPLV